MKILLAQHGDSLPEHVDPERPLSDRGRDDVMGMARLLGASGVRVRRICHSGKLRACQTAELLAPDVASDAIVEPVVGLPRMIRSSRWPTASRAGPTTHCSSGICHSWRARRAIAGRMGRAPGDRVPAGQHRVPGARRGGNVGHRVDAAAGAAALVVDRGSKRRSLLLSR